MKKQQISTSEFPTKLDCSVGNGCLNCLKALVYNTYACMRTLY